MNIEDLVVYHGKDLKELEKSFMKIVDKYISILEEPIDEDLSLFLKNL